MPEVVIQKQIQTKYNLLNMPQNRNTKQLSQTYKKYNRNNFKHAKIMQKISQILIVTAEIVSE
jgi:hypothetical protein